MKIRASSIFVLATKDISLPTFTIIIMVKNNFIECWVTNSLIVDIVKTGFGEKGNRLILRESCIFLGRLFCRYLCIPSLVMLSSLWWISFSFTSYIQWSGHCLVKLSFLHFNYTRMFPAAWENARILKEDIVIKGYRIPPNVSQSNNWISLLTQDSA